MKLAVIDFETTGKVPSNAEVLQCAIIDENGETLHCELYKPEFVTAWPGAEAVHGISPEKVKDKPHFSKAIAEIEKILNSAESVMAYNAGYEIGVLDRYGAKLIHNRFIDPMLMFAEVYGDWNEYYGNYRWQKLSTAASYYGYEFDAHDALADVKATLHVFNEMRKAGLPLHYVERCVRLCGVRR